MTNFYTSKDKLLYFQRQTFILSRKHVYTFKDKLVYFWEQTFILSRINFYTWLQVNEVSFLNLGVLTMTSHRPLLALNILFPKQVTGFYMHLSSALRSAAFGKLLGRAGVRECEMQSVSYLLMWSRCDDHADGEDADGDDVDGDDHADIDDHADGDEHADGGHGWGKRLS